MTTLNEARGAVYNRVLAEWPPVWPDIQFCFDDESLDPGTDANGKVLPWVRFSVRQIAAAQQTLGAPGNRKYTRRALVRAEVYTAPGTGQKVPDLMCQTALEMFEGRYLAGTLMYGGAAAEQGLVLEDRWKLSTVEVYFDYEEIK